MLATLKTGHPFQNITLYVHKKKEASDLSATDGRGDGRGMKPKILRGSSMATVLVVPHLIMVLNFDYVKGPLDILL